MFIPRKVRTGPCFGVVLLLTAGFFIATTVWPITSGHEPSTAHEEITPVSNAGIPATLDDDRPYNYPHPRVAFGEEVTFRYFDAYHTYQTEGVAERSLTRQEEMQLSSVREVALRHLKETKKDGGTFVGGRYRWLNEGVEYDFAFDDPVKEVTNRITLFQKLEPPKVIRSIEISNRLIVNIIITLKGRLDKYAVFLDHLVTAVVPEEPHLSLTVVYFSDDNMKEAQELTNHVLSSVPQVKWSFIPLEAENFSRGRGLHTGAQSVRFSDLTSPSSVLFFCDVDILMHPDFFRRCRSNAIEGRQVYYPVLFSLYNPRLVYPLFDKDIPVVRDQLRVTEQSGFWREFGFGMTCMYASDYEAAGGFPDLKTWGGEDEILFEKFLRLDNIKVLRFPDPGLFHLYHRKDCLDVTSSSYPACLKSKALTEGSQLQLGLTLLKLHEGTDLEGILSKRFYYFWLVPYLACFLFLSLVTNILQATAAISSRKIHVYGGDVRERRMS
ncbi:chondroitin sulfate N-acetylgalactosaminyltransferase 1-like [Palaemon carinicauda]|uniref:chondroitin sulfate N-acetylgalactosaminyltransferase 1-like n=1 Tax=Palaemon carinicauda TaxID=392227 RepID=UPI0035B64F0A